MAEQGKNKARNPEALSLRDNLIDLHHQIQIEVLGDYKVLSPAKSSDEVRDVGNGREVAAYLNEQPLLRSNRTYTGAELIKKDAGAARQLGIQRSSSVFLGFAEDCVVVSDEMGVPDMYNPAQASIVINTPLGKPGAYEQEMYAILMDKRPHVPRVRGEVTTVTESPHVDRIGKNVTEEDLLLGTLRVSMESPNEPHPEGLRSIAEELHSGVPLDRNYIDPIRQLFDFPEPQFIQGLPESQ